MNKDSRHIDPAAREVYERMVEVFFYFKPIEDLEKTVHQNFFGYGTAAHEFFQSRKELQKMAKLQAEQLRQQNFEIGRKKVLEKVLANSTSCLIVEEFELYLSESDHQMQLRLSTILEHMSGKWLVTHFHGSTPDSDIDEAEALPMEGLRKKNKELEARIKERTRDLEIEAALEKVRSRTMAMQNSSELPEAANVLFLEIQALGIPAWSCGYNILADDKKTATCWMSSEGTLQKPFTLRLFGEASFEEMGDFIRSKDSFLVQELGGKALKAHYNHMRSFPDLLPIFEDLESKGLSLPSYQINHLCKFSQGFLLFITYEPVPEAHDIFKRFNSVFEQTYTRFLDLQKAEAQAREAQIEAALERVRSRSMAMHKSEELAELSLELVKQVQSLGVATWFCAFNIYDDDPKGSLEWGSNGQGTFPKYRTPREGIFLRYYEAGKRGETLLINEIGEDECPAHYEYLCTLPGVGEQLLKMKDEGIPFPASQIDHVAFFKYGYVLFITYEPAPESHEIFKRFANVFEQTYTRFLDLKKAEAQAREAEIETALEKVRTASMTMQRSVDLANVIGVIFTQLEFLGVQSDGCALNLFDHEDGMEIWISGFGEEVHPHNYHIDFFDHPYYNQQLKEWKNQKKYSELTFEGALKKSYDEQTFSNEDFFNIPVEIRKSFLESDFKISCVANMKYGMLEVVGNEVLPEDQADLLCRFANVFELSYTRFLDLKKAEAQAREAEIEAALERVRSKTMAMHNSKDVGVTVVTLFDEVKKLELDDSIRCGIGILEGTEKMETWSANATPGGEVDLVVGMLDMSIHPMLSGLKKAWKNGKKGYAYEFKEGDVRTYYSGLNNEPEYPFNADLDSLPEKVYHNSFFFSAGILFAFTENPISEEATRVLNRFAGVFGQTYRRYLDLQKAEVQAREALKQATLDRIRGQVASMRSTEDLERITPLIWNELTALEIPFIRCGVFIIDESEKTVQAFLSAPDGHSLGAMRIPFDADKDTAATVAHWKKKEVYKTHWDKSQFLEFMQLMIDLGQVSNEKEYQGAEQPPDSLHLHFVPFTQGMLYVGNVEALEEDQIELVRTLAEAFAIAYARYEDFVRLEKAKEQVENTLEELKSAQNQLVQSEKMASLGELTAGIAHEIQNPLNFVNNFSEVSVELLEELQEEMKKGDLEEINALIEDIQQNLDKINHHGQRADGIVKGMLQHSRNSSGEKELTDLNVLADEYLRLAYHGLRAKDKTFNAIIETHFDEGLGKVNVVPQDIGRVILNLITNAFYVVKEKGEQQPEGYDPTVSVTTIKEKDKVILRVKDNGNGIPKEIQDKIFQPFFTTKPTGEGTGLGLSMSYDIVTKGHGGDLKVESVEGTGTTMTISLPIQKISGS